MSMSKISPKKIRPTAIVPVTTLEEVPVLDERERAKMLASLHEAEARVAAGEFETYDPANFKDRLIAIYKAARFAKTA